MARASSALPAVIVTWMNWSPHARGGITVGPLGLWREFVIDTQASRPGLLTVGPPGLEAKTTAASCCWLA